MNPLSNTFLVYAFVVTIALHFLAVYAPFMQKILRTSPLSLYDWAYIVAVSLTIVLAEELRKLAYRASARRAARP
jgi:magnesium-transporting ATPase (P-type)